MTALTEERMEVWGECSNHGVERYYVVRWRMKGSLKERYDAEDKEGKSGVEQL